MIEHIISLIAPHTCVGCSSEGSLLCASCARILPFVGPVSCPQCAEAGCVVCLSPVAHIYAATYYERQAKEIIHQLKFARARAAAGVIAQIIAERLPCTQPETVITFVPTAPRRVRLRGYDQAERIARRVAALEGLTCTPLLGRYDDRRQVGQDRSHRRAQARGAFYALRPKDTPKRVLLIDDVITTGSTIQAAAAMLSRAGADHVDVAAFALAKKFG